MFAMTQRPDPGKNWWILSFLVTGDEDGVMAVSAEGLIRSTLWDDENGSQPLTSTVRRFCDMSLSEQEDWHRALQQSTDD